MVSCPIFLQNHMTGESEFVKRRPGVTMETVDKFLTKCTALSPTRFSRDTRFRRSCDARTDPPDDIPGHALRRRHGGRDARAKAG
jgi:hypothetical protein